MVPPCHDAACQAFYDRHSCRSPFIARIRLPYLALYVSLVLRHLLGATSVTFSGSLLTCAGNSSKDVFRSSGILHVNIHILHYGSSVKSRFYPVRSQNARRGYVVCPHMTSVICMTPIRQKTDFTRDLPVGAYEGHWIFLFGARRDTVIGRVTNPDDGLIVC